MSQRVEVHPGREVVVEFDPSLTFECVDGCTWCCHHGVLLYGEDLRELSGRESIVKATTEFKGKDFVRTESKTHDQAGEDGRACFFLGEDGLCALQKDHNWKPTRCSVFPLCVFVEDDEIHVSVRDDAQEHCEGLGESERRVIDNLDAFLPELLWELDDPATAVEL